MLRPVGIRSIASRLSTAVFAAEVTSTTGEAPVTVIVSSRRADAELGVQRGGEFRRQLAGRRAGTS